MAIQGYSWNITREGEGEGDGKTICNSERD